MNFTHQDLFKRTQKQFFFIAGPCALESLELGLEVGQELARLSNELGVCIIFKSSFDKANRTSMSSFRGPGLEKGLKWLDEIRKMTGLPVLTDIHLPDQACEVARVADVLQIPAFLCRQTDLLVAAAKTERIINIKKGQFVAPWDMQNVLDKLAYNGNKQIWLTERGTCFGYNNLVVDFRSLAIMGAMNVPIVFDATHSVQLPGGQGNSSGGQREFVPILSRAAVAAGCSAVFMEVHPDPDRALCDGTNSWPLNRVQELMLNLLAIREARNAG